MKERQRERQELPPSLGLDTLKKGLAEGGRRLQGRGGLWPGKTCSVFRKIGNDIVVVVVAAAAAAATAATAIMVWWSQCQ